MSNFGHLSSAHFPIYVSKDVCIRCYFSKLKGVREQKRLGNTAIEEQDTHHCFKPAPNVSP